jgi:hypothetical protein
VVDRLDAAIKAAADGFATVSRAECSDLLKCCGAKGNRTADLLDANESKRVFVWVS